MTWLETECAGSLCCSSPDVILRGQSPVGKAVTHTSSSWLSPGPCLLLHTALERVNRDVMRFIFSALFILNQFTFPFVIIHSFFSSLLGQTQMFLRIEIQLIRPFWIHKGSAVREVNPRWKNLGLGSDSVAAHLPSMGELPSSISPPYPYTEKKKKKNSNWNITEELC